MLLVARLSGIGTDERQRVEAIAGYRRHKSIASAPPKDSPTTCGQSPILTALLVNEAAVFARDINEVTGHESVEPGINWIRAGRLIRDELVWTDTHLPHVTDLRATEEVSA